MDDISLPDDIDTFDAALNLAESKERFRGLIDGPLINYEVEKRRIHIIHNQSKPITITADEIQMGDLDGLHVLRVFGHQIKKLKLSEFREESRYAEYVGRYLAKYCADTLIDLTIVRSENLLAALPPIHFKRLDSFAVYGIRFSGVREIPLTFDRLNELDIFAHPVDQWPYKLVATNVVRSLALRSTSLAIVFDLLKTGEQPSGLEKLTVELRQFDNDFVLPSLKKFQKLQEITFYMPIHSKDIDKIVELVSSEWRKMSYTLEITDGKYGKILTVTRGD